MHFTMKFHSAVMHQSRGRILINNQDFLDKGGVKGVLLIIWLVSIFRVKILIKRVILNTMNINFHRLIYKFVNIWDYYLHLLFCNMLLSIILIHILFMCYLKIPNLLRIGITKALWCMPSLLITVFP